MSPLPKLSLPAGHYSHALIVDRLTVRRHGRLFERFGQRRVRVARPRHVLAACAVLEGQRALSDHFSGIGPHDVDAQYPVGLGVSEKLDYAFGVEVGLCAAVGGEGEGANVVFYACGEYVSYKR